MNYVADIGGPTVVARALGLSTPTVHGWKRVPERHCPELEKLSEGRLTVEQMRPDVAWVRTPDPHWPHPSGRPLADYARETLHD
ncbi:hypothetical protein EII18_02955 [Comamonadaceae bacterium OH3737_COT-264]|nr:hypothetical protein EII18_02955 [Comamonadaceae bacterium OH3737_COT-264]